MADEKAIPVRVALRGRPLVTKEVNEGCQIGLRFVPGEPQVVVGRDKAFTFDYAFSCESKQHELYDQAVADRIEYIFKGYNVTVLAYGQTGSGKTYTMGTAYSSSATDDESQVGVIQRVVRDLFSGIEQRSANSEFTIKVSFLEVYKEDVFDLLQKNKYNMPITIREDTDGIKVVGLTEMPVFTAEQTLLALEQGSLSRTTASTAMNSRSSRSHAIFTIIVEQKNLNDPSDVIRSKFHLVDLAGSERANKTGAMGERFKEGVNINRGLLALGNVISALGEDASHVPYRDSKLTRLLQDSLGGNSHTVMIACVSPADSNLDESVNTLRYADRARKIKNKPIVNRDPQNAEMMRLKQEIQELKMMNAKMSGTVPNINVDNNMNYKELLDRNMDLISDNEKVTKELQNSLDQITVLCEKVLMAESNKESLVHELECFQTGLDEVMEELSAVVNDNPVLQAHLEKFKKLQDKLATILSNRIQRDREQSEYSATRYETTDVESGDENASQDMNEDKDEAKLRLDSSSKQAAMGRQLMELDRALALKEEIAMKIKSSDDQITVIKTHFETNMKQMEEEINLLQKEKEELVSTLKAKNATTNASKISEQRRKRIQECEAQISLLKKQILEKSKVLKFKEDSEKKVSVLQQEIHSMKSARVKLLKQMKEEAERYRTLKVQKDREVAQLKQKERKRQYEIVKMKQDFTNQKNVLKRKMEEATAANKRLNNALNQQRSVAERRAKEKTNSLQGIGTRIQQFLTQEMEVVLSSKEASCYLQTLLDDRKAIAEDLNMLRQNADSPENEVNEETRDETNSQIAALEQELEMRNVQITDLQQKILDADQDDRCKQRFDTIQNMVEVQCALKFLFDKAISAQMDVFHKKSTFEQRSQDTQRQLQQYESQMQILHKNNEYLKTQLESMKQESEYREAQLNIEIQDKTLCLLRQLNTANALDHSDPACKEDIEKIKKFQSEEIDRLSCLNSEIQKLTSENRSLREQLINERKVKKDYMLGDIIKMDETIVIEKKVKKKRHSIMEHFLDDEDECVSSTDEDAENDPDWRATPVNQRNKKRGSSNEEAIDMAAGDQPSRKRSFISCGCRGNCINNHCSCRKQQKMCTEACKCPDPKCTNRDNSRLVLDNPDDSNSMLSVSNQASQSRPILMEVTDNNVQNLSLDDFTTSKSVLTLKTTSTTEPNLQRIFDEGGVKEKTRRKRKNTYLPLKN